MERTQKSKKIALFIVNRKWGEKRKGFQRICYINKRFPRRKCIHTHISIHHDSRAMGFIFIDGLSVSIAIASSIHTKVNRAHISLHDSNRIYNLQQSILNGLEGSSFFLSRKTLKKINSMDEKRIEFMASKG